MRSEKQQEASRANGRRSHGPVTPQGKQRSSQNALRHGLLAQTTVLEHETQENFILYLEQHLDRFQPDDDVELNVIEEMVSASWRLRRIWVLQTRLLDNEIVSHPGENAFDAMADAFGKQAKGPALSLLLRYETRLHLIYHRCINTLKSLRASRPDGSLLSAAEPESPVPNEPNQVERSEATQPRPLAPGPRPPISPAPNEPNQAEPSEAAQPRPPAPGPRPLLSSRPT